MKSSNSAAAAMRAVFDNNWFYVACIELWGIYVRLPLPFLPVYFYVPLLFFSCYVIFFVWELIRMQGRIGAAGAGNGECGLTGSDSEREDVHKDLYEQAADGEITRKDFMHGLAQVMTSKSSYLIAALCAVPPYWLAEYYYDEYPFGLAVRGAVMLVSFAVVFAFLADQKAKKTKRPMERMSFFRSFASDFIFQPPEISAEGKMIVRLKNQVTKK